MSASSDESLVKQRQRVRRCEKTPRSSHMPEKLSAPLPLRPLDFFQQSKIAIWRAGQNKTANTYVLEISL
jgi:hypothetical protein